MCRVLAILLTAPALVSALSSQVRFSDLGYAPTPIRSAIDVEAGDFDGDGRSDLVTLDQRAIVFRKSQSGGVYSARTILASPKGSILASGDFDGDGITDIYLAGWTGADDRLFRSLGASQFRDESMGRLPSFPGVRSAAVARDIDKDGDVDLIVGTKSFIHLLINVNGKFIDESGRRIVGNSGVQRLQVADVNNDGRLDIVSTGGGGGGFLVVHFQEAGGRFVAARSLITPIQGSAVSLSLADIDKDGDLDVFIGKTWASDMLWRNDGTKFVDVSDKLPQPKRALTVPEGSRFADLDGDGDQDLIVLKRSLHIYKDRDRVYLGDGTGQFKDETASSLPTKAGSFGMRIADIDDDGDLDILRVTSTGALQPVYNLQRHVAAPQFAELASTPSIDVYGQSRAQGLLSIPYVSLLRGTRALHIAPFGVLDLEASSMIQLPILVHDRNSGKASLKVAIPSIPSLVRQRLYAQALLVRVTVSGSSIRLSNTSNTLILP